MSLETTCRDIRAGIDHRSHPKKHDGKPKMHIWNPVEMLLNVMARQASILCSFHLTGRLIAAWHSLSHRNTPKEKNNDVSRMKEKRPVKNQSVNTFYYYFPSKSLFPQTPEILANASISNKCTRKTPQEDEAHSITPSVGLPHDNLQSLGVTFGSEPIPRYPFICDTKHPNIQIITSPHVT